MRATTQHGEVERHAMATRSSVETEVRATARNEVQAWPDPRRDQVSAREAEPALATGERAPARIAQTDRALLALSRLLGRGAGARARRGRYEALGRAALFCHGANMGGGGGEMEGAASSEAGLDRQE